MKRNGDLLLEAVGLLNTLTPAQATSTLRTVADQQDSLEIIELIRQATNTATHDVDPETSSRFGPRSLPQELASRHPFIYPNEGRDFDAADKLLKELLPSSSPQNNLYPEQDMLEPRAESFAEHSRLNTTLPPPSQPDIDPELDGLDITLWTDVEISNDFAARAISVYLSTDHNLLSPFHRGLFLQDLVSADEPGDYCSSAMVNALLYWCCQMYASIEVDAILKANAFRLEAEEWLEVELDTPKSTTMVAAMFLSLGHLAQGRDHAVMRHLKEAADTGVKLGLFGVPEETAQATRDQLTESQAKALAYPSWGVFNWIVLMTLFYRQQNVTALLYPPALDVPDSEGTSKADADHMELESELGPLPSQSYAGDTFAALCHFWRIMYDVATVYYGGHEGADQPPLTLQFAEYKFRELLAWTDELPLTLARSGDNPGFVVILHLWLHSAILDIFRPFLQGSAPQKRRLRTFAPPMNTPDAAYGASVEQLKRLIITYRSKYPASHYSIIWQTSLLYTANAMLHSEENDRLTYFLICLYSYADMRQSFRVTEAIVRALLSMGMQNGVITEPVAQLVLRDLRSIAPEEGDASDETIRAPFIVDLDQAVSAPDSATVEAQSASFEENMMLWDYTSLFEID